VDHKYTIAGIGPKIEQFLGPVIRITGFDLNWEIEQGQHLHPDFEDPEIVVKFSGPDVDLLLANKAELMLALEQLTMEVLRMPADDHSRLCFDANDYRVLRIEELRLSAATAAEKVKQTRRPFHFNPMNSRERRIIHLSLRNETDVRSESTGVGPIRQVVIVPSEMQTVPEPIRPPHPGPPRDGPRRGGPSRGGPPHGGPPRSDSRGDRRPGPRDRRR
jgi:spoIIIJ-associated protein